MKRNTFKIILLVFMGVIIMLSFIGCGKKYKLDLPAGFESKKTSYAAGEEVTVTYRYFATDTDYSFYWDADDVRQSFDDGYVFTFIMPERDVTFWEESHNSMEYRPEKEYTEKDLLEMIDEDRMVFDYYEATTGTDGGDGYTEYVLYRWEENDLLLAVYTKYADEAETKRVCRVPLAYLYDCLKIVNKNGMKDWKDGEPIDGMAYAVRFKEKGETVRISSEDMPAGGTKAFAEVEQALRGAWSVYGPKGTDPGSIGIIDDPKPVEETE